MSSQQLTNLRVTNRMILPIWTNLVTINGQSLVTLRESVDINTYMPPADGNYGDITVSGAGTVWTINPLVVTTGKIGANAVTFAKFQTIATDTLLGRDTGGTGNVESIGLNTTLSMDGAGNLQRSALTGDITASAGSNATTLATVNGNVGSFGSATQVGTFTVNAKGLITAAGSTTVTPAVGSISGLGTGVATALAVNTGSAGALVVNGGALGTPSSGVATNLTGTASGLTAGNVTTNANLTGPITSVGNATSIASQTGTGTTFAMSVGPSFTGATKAAQINVGGTTQNGIGFFKSTTDIALASTTHAATFGDESTGQNLAIGTYSTGTGIQSRNNGANGALFISPIGGSDTHVGGSFAGKQALYLNNTDAGTTSYAALEIRNANSANDALRLYCMGTGWTTSGMNKQDYGVVATGTSISGLSIGTQASAPIEIYTNNTLRTTWAASTGNISTTGQVVSTGGGIGYAAGAGGTVTQGTSRSTGVTLNKLCGTITMFSSAQSADSTVTFTLTNSFIASTDFIMVQHISATNGGAWEFSVVAGSGSCTITVRNTSAGSITEATPLRFIILKAATT